MKNISKVVGPLKEKMVPTFESQSKVMESPPSNRDFELQSESADSAFSLKSDGNESDLTSVSIITPLAQNSCATSIVNGIVADSVTRSGKVHFLFKVTAEWWIFLPSSLTALALGDILRVGADSSMLGSGDCEIDLVDLLNYLKELRPLDLAFLSCIRMVSQMYAPVMKINFRNYSSVSNATVTTSSSCMDLNASYLVFEKLKEKMVQLVVDVAKGSVETPAKRAVNSGLNSAMSTDVCDICGAESTKNLTPVGAVKVWSSLIWLLKLACQYFERLCPSFGTMVWKSSDAHFSQFCVVDQHLKQLLSGAELLTFTTKPLLPVLGRNLIVGDFFEIPFDPGVVISSFSHITLEDKGDLTGRLFAESHSIHVHEQIVYSCLSAGFSKDGSCKGLQYYVVMRREFFVTALWGWTDIFLIDGVNALALILDPFGSPGFSAVIIIVRNKNYPSTVRDLVMRPHVFIIDEPFYRLDSVSTLLLMGTSRIVAFIFMFYLLGRAGCSEEALDLIKVMSVCLTTFEVSCAVGEDYHREVVAESIAFRLDEESVFTFDPGRGYWLSSGNAFVSQSLMQNTRYGSHKFAYGSNLIVGDVATVAMQSCAYWNIFNNEGTTTEVPSVHSLEVVFERPLWNSFVKKLEAFSVALGAIQCIWTLPGPTSCQELSSTGVIFILIVSGTCTSGASWCVYKGTRSTSEVIPAHFFNTEFSRVLWSSCGKSLVTNKSAILEGAIKIFSARSIDEIVYSLCSLLALVCNYRMDASKNSKDVGEINCKVASQELDVCGVICFSLQFFIQQYESILKDTMMGATLSLSSSVLVQQIQTKKCELPAKFNLFSSGMLLLHNSVKVPLEVILPVVEKQYIVKESSESMLAKGTVKAVSELGLSLVGLLLHTRVYF
ncbi:uncharacterized protein [Nicotiana tomentosiformis]|uniref:uncharacterized protein n=1 Tax=Nicotiana tomentosiformis TaxID=4098 RepID=UPI0008789C98|nr:uncharacterized protein LOC104109977 [Nicotiana tomentosiformis]